MGCRNSPYFTRYFIQPSKYPPVWIALPFWEFLAAPVPQSSRFYLLQLLLSQVGDSASVPSPPSFRPDPQLLFPLTCVASPGPQHQRFYPRRPFPPQRTWAEKSRSSLLSLQSASNRLRLPACRSAVKATGISHADELILTCIDSLPSRLYLYYCPPPLRCLK